MTAVTTAPKWSLEVRAIGLQLLFIGLVVGVPFGLATASSIFRDGDVSWQIAAGQWIIRNGRIPTTDPFSFTAAGRPWVAMEWLSEILFAAAFKLAGFAGLATVVATAVMTTFGIVFFYLQRRTSPFLICATLVAASLVLAPFALARPHVLAWPLIAGWTVILLSAAEEGHPPPLYSTVMLLVWTNVHASFVLSLPIAAAIGFDSLVQHKWANLRAWLVFGLVAVIALTLNANGLVGLEQPFRTSSLQMLPYIAEWHPSTISVTPFFFEFVLLGIGGLLRSGIRVPMGRLVLLLLLLTLALAHVRHQNNFIIVAACIVPTLWPSGTRWVPAPSWLAATALPFLAFRLLMPLTPPEGPANPRSLIAAIPPELRSQPVFNDYTFGGPLILAGIKPYIDGRAEIYGDQFVMKYTDITDGDTGAFDSTVQRYGIRWVILQRNEKLLEALEASGKWHRIYADQIGAILVPSAIMSQAGRASIANADHAQ